MIIVRSPSRDQQHDQRVLIAEIVDEAISGDDIGKAPPTTSATVEVLQRARACPSMFQKGITSNYFSSRDADRDDGPERRLTPPLDVVPPRTCSTSASASRSEHRPVHMLDGLGHRCPFAKFARRGEGRRRSRWRASFCLASSARVRSRRWPAQRDIIWQPSDLQP